MAEKKIWQFSKFDGGINNYTDAKDINNNEFVELVDCDVSRVGIIKALGHALKANNVASKIISDDIFSGTGLFNYFSDWTFTAYDFNHLNFETSDNIESVWDGSPAYIDLLGEFQSGYYIEDFQYMSDSLLWIFNGRPTGGELRISLQIQDDTGTWNPIHGQLDGTGQYLTVVKGDDWSTLGTEVLTNPTTETAHGGTKVNLLRQGTDFQPNISGDLESPTILGSHAFSTNNSWLGAIPMASDSNPLDDPYSIMVLSSPFDDARQTVSAGNSFDQSQPFQTLIDGSEGLYSVIEPFTSDGWAISNNESNTPYPFYYNQDREEYPEFWWVDNTNASGFDNWELYQTTYHEDIGVGNGGDPSEFYFHNNDNRNLLGYNGAVDSKAFNMIGYFFQWAGETDGQGFIGEEEWESMGDYYHHQIGNEPNPYDNNSCFAFFPYGDLDRNRIFQACTNGPIHVKFSIWMHLIKAINAYTNDSGTLNYKNDFKAYFRNQAVNIHEGNEPYLGKPHYTMHPSFPVGVDDEGNFIYPSNFEELILKSKHNDSRVNSSKIRAVFTVANLKPDNTTAPYNTELITNSNDRDFAASDINWRGFTIHHPECLGITNGTLQENFGLTVNDFGNDSNESYFGLNRSNDGGPNTINYLPYPTERIAVDSGALRITSADLGFTSNGAFSHGAVLNNPHMGTMYIGRTYRVSAVIRTTNGATLTGFRMQLGGTKSDLFDISGSSTPIVRDLYFGIGGSINDLTGVSGYSKYLDGIFDTSNGAVDSNWDGSLRIYKEIENTTNGGTGWIIDDVSVKEMPPTFVGDDDTWYDTNHIIRDGINWYQDDDVWSYGDATMWLNHVRQGYSAGMEVKIGTSLATAKNMFISDIANDVHDDNGQYVDIHLYSGNHDDINVGGMLNAASGPLKIFKKRINIKLDVHYWGGGVEDNAQEEFILGNKHPAGSGFVRNFHNAYNNFINGRTTSGYYSKVIGALGPNNSGDTIKISYTLPEGVTNSAGLNSGYLENAGGDTFTFTLTKSENLNELITIISGASQTPQLTASAYGPEVISDNASLSSFHKWQTVGNPLNTVRVIEVEGGEDYIRVRKNTAVGSEKVGISLGRNVESNSGNFYNNTNEVPDGSLSFTPTNCCTDAQNVLKPNKTYTVTFDAKHDIDSGNSLTGFRVKLGNVETAAFSITTSWATYTKDISLGGSIPESTDNDANSLLKIFSANDYSGGSLADSKFWNIKNISIKEKNSDSYMTVTSSIAGTAGYFDMALEVDTYFSSDFIVPEGKSEEFTALITSGGQAEYNLEDNHYKYYVNLFLHSKLYNVWSERFKWDEDKFDWYYSKIISTGEYNYPDILMWNESNRLRIIDASFVDSISQIDNKAKYIDKFNISKWFNSDYSTWTWAQHGPSVSLNIADIFNVDKFWDKSISTSGTRGLFINSEDNDWNSLSTFGDGAGIKFKFTKLSPTYNSTTGDKTTGVEGTDWAGTVFFYASAIYDDGGEGLPAHKFSSEITFDGQTILDVDLLTDTLKIECAIKPLTLDEKFIFDDKRITGIRIYYTHSEEGHETFWSLAKLTWEDGFIKATNITTIDSTAGNAGAITYEDHQSESSMLQIHDSSKTFTDSTCDINDSTTITCDASSQIKIGMSVEDENGYIPVGAYVSAIVAGTEGSSVTSFQISAATTGGDNDNYTLTFKQKYGHFTVMPKLESFESINGYSPYNTTLKAKYKAHTIAGRRSFIGNVEMHDGIFNDRMIVSPVNQLDTFPYPGNVLDLDISDGDEIIALANVGDKIIQFKKNMSYIINISTAIPSEFFVEEKHKFKGISNRNHFVETADGVFWVNEFGAYMYTGEELIDLHSSSEDDTNAKRINLDKWTHFTTSKSQVGYNPITKDCFVVKKNEYNVLTDGDCYVYNIPTNSWSYGYAKFYTGSNTKITNFINIGDNSRLGYIYNLGYGVNPQIDGSPL